jgi:hypothetical protein
LIKEFSDRKLKQKSFFHSDEGAWTLYRQTGALIKRKSNFHRIQSGAVAKIYKGRVSYIIYEELLKYFPIYEEAVSHI